MRGGARHALMAVARRCRKPHHAAAVRRISAGPTAGGSRVAWSARGPVCRSARAWPARAPCERRWRHPTTAVGTMRRCGASMVSKSASGAARCQRLAGFGIADLPGLAPNQFADIDRVADDATAQAAPGEALMVPTPRHRSVRECRRGSGRRQCCAAICPRRIRKRCAAQSRPVDGTISRTPGLPDTVR